MARTKKLSIKVEPSQATRFTKSVARVITALAEAKDLKSLDVFKMRRDLQTLVRSFDKMWPDENERMVALMHIGQLYQDGLPRFLTESHIAAERMKAALDVAKAQSRQGKQSRRRRRA